MFATMAFSLYVLITPVWLPSRPVIVSVSEKPVPEIVSTIRVRPFITFTFATEPDLDP